MQRKSTLRIFLAALAILTISPTSARTWTSADGKSTFEGDLIAYSADTGEVTVDRGGKRITFKQQTLSASDIAFLKNGEATPVTTPKPAESSTPKPPVSTPMKSTAAPANDKPDYPFTPAPQANGKPWLIKTFGPVGIGIMLEKGLVMKIQNVEAGSPAEKTGKLKQGDIIESINGMRFSDTKRDLRFVLANLERKMLTTDFTD